MTLQLERARTRRPITWLTLIGVVLLPVVIGGILVAALYNPVERLDAMSAAIVNEDDPVTIDGQLVPLGRQLTAGLVEGSDEVPSNLDWTISNADDAAEGLADGTYAAVITIPSNFSAAATSTAPGNGAPEQATIEVETAPDALIVDDAITAQVTQAAASVMSQQLSQVYLENVFLGFTTLGDKLGEAADGAHQLADGAAEAADGAAQLPDGASQLATGATGLSTGAVTLGSGLDRIAAGIESAADGASQLAAGVRGGASKIEQDGIVPDQILGFAADAAGSTAATAQKVGAVAVSVGGLAQSAGGLAQTLGGLNADCVASGASAEFCARIDTAAGSATGLAQAAGGAAQDAGAAAQSAVTAATDAGYANGGLAQFEKQAPAEFAAQFRTIADGIESLAGGLTKLSAGATQSADGARQLGDGAAQLSDGASQLADGASALADGVSALADGTEELAGGLDTAVSSLPSYTDAEATDLASVVAEPVAAEGAGTSLFGASAIPLLSTLALWFGALGTFVALRAVSRRTLTSRAPSAVLTLRAFAPAAALGALQGLLVAGVVQLAAGYDFAAWSVFAGVSIAAGIAFAAANQALIAVFGGAGRWISALIGVLAVATGVVSTVPGVLSSIASIMPTTPAYNAMLAALTSASGVGAGLAGLLAWSALALGATMLAVARRRTTSARALIAASPA